MMMSKRRGSMLVTALLVMVAMGWVVIRGWAQDTAVEKSEVAGRQTPGSIANAPASETQIPFVDGKVVTVVTEITGDGGMYLEEAEIRKLGDAWFLTGKFARFGRANEIDGLKRVWVPLSAVKQIYEYESKVVLNFDDDINAN
jgi:hypothetical protein